MRDLERENRRWREANPWLTLNLQNSSSASGSYATKEQAIAAVGCCLVEVNDDQKTVYFSRTPSL